MLADSWGFPCTSRKIRPASADKPTDICTGVPLAKSKTPLVPNKPSGCQVIWVK